MCELKDKVAIITGGTRGLGFGIAQAYVRAGAKVTVASRSVDSVENAVKALQKMGGDVGGICCDVGKMDDVKDLGSYAIERFGGFNVWVNNAGVSCAYGPTIHIPHAQVENVFRTNIMGTYYGSLIAMQHFLRKGHGKLINISGRGDKAPVPLQNAYASSKSWMRSFTLALADEYKESGVGVFLFKPGIVDTDMLQKVEAIMGYEKRVAGLRTVVRMWGSSPQVPAEKAVWLASPATDGKTGMVVSVLNGRKMMKGLLQEGAERLLRRSREDFNLQITAIQPEFIWEEESGSKG